MSAWSRLANVFRSGRLSRDLDEELAFHRDERARELMAEGLAPDAARREAARRLGRSLQLREESLDVKRLAWLDSIVRDIRIGLRLLRRNGVVMGAAIVSLALALGACLAAFSLVDALMLRPLPVGEPERLVYLTFANHSRPEGSQGTARAPVPPPEGETFSDPMFVRLREAGAGRVHLFAMSAQVRRFVLFDPASEKERTRTQFVSGDTFDRLGVRPAFGRMFTAADDVTPGAHPVAVISHAFWMRRFGGDPGVIGRWIGLEERPLEFRQFQIVGISERTFPGVEPGRPTDLWLPYSMYNARAFGSFSFNWFRVLGRLERGVSAEQAETVLRPTFTRTRQELAQFGRAESPEDIKRYLAAPLYVRSAATGPSPLRREFEGPLTILAVIALLILLIAGSNVANLLLARTAARSQEMALRLSIGAGRARLIQQVLIESALVAVVATALALLVAAAGGPMILGLLTPAEDPVHLDLRLDARLVIVAALLSLGVTALFALAPAIGASRAHPSDALKHGTRSSFRVAALRPFVAAQVAFSLAVLFLGGLFVLSFVRLAGVNPGFASDNVLLLSLETVRRAPPEEQRTALMQVLERLRGVSGVGAASSAEFNVLGRPWTYGVRVPGSGETFEASIAPVLPQFFETMRIPPVAGRTFAESDVRGARPVLVVNETFAHKYFGGQPGVGRTIPARFGVETDTADGYEVVGVVRDVRFDLRQSPAPTIYLPMPLRSNGTLHVRTAADDAALTARLREEVRAASPLFRVASITTQSQVVTETILRERLLAMLAGFFALVGLLLAAIGLYGVLSYAVDQRTREIGIRLALGARPAAVVRAIVADAALTTAAGAACGLVAGLYLSRFVESLLFDVTALDVSSLALPAGLMMAAALFAAAVPAWRATRVDPVIALRDE